MRNIFFLGLLLASLGGTAESQEIDVNTTPIPDLLERWVAARAAWDHSDVAYNSVSDLITMIDRPLADQDALIDGLVDIARSGPNSVRYMAVASLALMGHDGAAMRNPRAVPLLLQLFSDSNDESVRMAVVDSFLGLANPAVGLGVIRRVLTEEPTGTRYDWMARKAVTVAIEVGPQGHALLRELHQAGTITDGSARAKVAREIAAGRISGG